MARSPIRAASQAQSRVGTRRLTSVAPRAQVVGRAGADGPPRESEGSRPTERRRAAVSGALAATALQRKAASVGRRSPIGEWPPRSPRSLKPFPSVAPRVPSQAQAETLSRAGLSVPPSPGSNRRASDSARSSACKRWPSRTPGRSIRIGQPCCPSISPYSRAPPRRICSRPSCTTPSPR